MKYGIVHSQLTKRERWSRAETPGFNSGFVGNSLLTWEYFCKTFFLSWNANSRVETSKIVERWSSYVAQQLVTARYVRRVPRMAGNTERTALKWLSAKRRVSSDVKWYKIRGHPGRSLTVIDMPRRRTIDVTREWKYTKALWNWNFKLWKKKHLQLLHGFNSHERRESCREKKHLSC